MIFIKQGLSSLVELLSKPLILIEVHVAILGQRHRGINLARVLALWLEIELLRCCITETAGQKWIIVTNGDVRTGNVRRTDTSS